MSKKNPTPQPSFILWIKGFPSRLRLLISNIANSSFLSADLEKKETQVSGLESGKVLVGFSLDLKSSEGNEHPKHGYLSSNAFLYPEHKLEK